MDAKPIFIIHLPFNSKEELGDFNKFKETLPGYHILVILENIQTINFEMFSPLTCEKTEIDKLKKKCQKAFESYSRK